MENSRLAMRWEELGEAHRRFYRQRARRREADRHRLQRERRERRNRIIMVAMALFWMMVILGLMWLGQEPV